MRHFGLRHLRQGICRVLKGTAGTSMVEFLITLPVLITIFVGIARLGELSRHSVKVWAVAHGKTFDRFTELQRQTLTDAASDPGAAVHLSSAAAAPYMTTDVTTGHPPTQDDTVLVQQIRRIESQTYGSGLRQHGHIGEAYRRVQPLEVAGVRPLGVHGALSPRLDMLIGQGRTRRSLYANELLNDSGAFTGSGGSGGNSNCESFLDEATQTLNDQLSASGARPVIAAGMRYGATSQKHTDTMTIGSWSVDMSAWFNTAVAPPVYPSSEAWKYETLATLTARMAMEQCRALPYQRLLGISPSDADVIKKMAGSELTDDEAERLGLPAPTAPFVIETHNIPDDLELSWPLNYGSQPP